jgi:hypothetical protein
VIIERVFFNIQSCAINTDVTFGLLISGKTGRIRTKQRGVGSDKSLCAET